ncbi:hypothetical protein IKP85_02950 [bacterium]|nr:hypothetical protein [bacterium]
MNTIQFNDGETRRQQRNLTGVQRRNNNKTKEGVIVNTFVKGDDDSFINTPLSLDETRDALIISNEVKLPRQLNENRTNPERSLLPISALAVGVMGIFAGVSMFIKRNAKITNEIAKEKWITSFTRNISINEESVQAIVQMVQNPNIKTIRAGLGVLTLTAMAFMGKTFMDGFKDVWVKKREADIQKNLQEQLIAVETRSFSGKMQIIRNSLSEKTKMFSKYLTDSEPAEQPFGMFKSSKELAFGQRVNKEENNNRGNLGYFLLGAGTLASIVGLSLFSLKNLQAGSKETAKFIEKTKQDMAIIAASGKDKKFVKNYLENMLQFINATKADIEAVVAKTPWKDKEKKSFVSYVNQKIETSTVKVNPNIGGDGTQKPSFSSFVDDYRAFFYNMLIEPDNKQFQQLFYGTTALAAVSYGGKVIGDAIKEVQVKKINAQTELNLQNRLVSTELRNFKAKKDAAIQPLVDEFYRKVDEGKSKEQLKTIAENILLEIKNGPPFVYS